MATMKSVVLRGDRLKVEEVAMPVPGSGQVLVKSRACGICGSDLHVARHSQEIYDFLVELGALNPASTPELEVSLGHEFSAEIVSFGPDTQQILPVGQRVTSVPFLLSGGEQVGVGVTPGVYGAYSQYFLLQEEWLLEVPDGMPDEAVAIAEPMGIGLHAVNHGATRPDEVALVVGCGPIGVACIVSLVRQGVKTIVASDPQPAARAMAEEYGATHTVNPVDADEIELAAQLADGSRVVIFECVGIPSMIPDLIKRAPNEACIVFNGLHTGEVSFSPAHALMKQLNIKHSYYYTPEEYAESLRALADEEIPWQSLVTGKVGIDGVPDAFSQLMKPNSHIKVVVDPWGEGALQTQ